MILLVLGVVLWFGAHALKRVAPDMRARLGDEKGKGPIAIAIVVSVVLMVIGYRMADGAFFWGRSSALVGVNNLLMLVAFYLFAVSGAKTSVARRIRHPQLTGFAVFCVAHLLVNGDVPSFVLFGGLLIWAVWSIITINRAGDWTPPAHDLPVPKNKEIKAAVIAVIAYVVVALLHGLVGPWPFG